MNGTLIAGLLTLGLSMAVAQDQPKLEVFGGYSLESIVPCGSGCREQGVPFPPTNFNGWNASVTAYVYKSLGITADFAGHYASHVVYDPVAGAHRYSYLFGPTYSVHGRVGSVFAHVLLGEVSQGSSQLSALDYMKFALAVGCGLDLNVSRRLAIRIAQFDYERARVPSFNNASAGTESENGFRYSAGAVFKF